MLKKSQNSLVDYQILTAIKLYYLSKVVLSYDSDKKINGPEQSPEVEPHLYRDLVQKISDAIGEWGRAVLLTDSLDTKFFTRGNR